MLVDDAYGDTSRPSTFGHDVGAVPTEGGLDSALTSRSLLVKGRVPAARAYHSVSSTGTLRTRTRSQLPRSGYSDSHLPVLSPGAGAASAHRDGKLLRRTAVIPATEHFHRARAAPPSCSLCAPDPAATAQAVQPALAPSVVHTRVSMSVPPNPPVQTTSSLQKSGKHVLAIQSQFGETGRSGRAFGGRASRVSLYSFGELEPHLGNKECRGMSPIAMGAAAGVVELTTSPAPANCDLDSDGVDGVDRGSTAEEQLAPWRVQLRERASSQYAQKLERFTKERAKVSARALEGMELEALNQTSVLAQLSELRGLGGEDGEFDVLPDDNEDVADESIASSIFKSTILSAEVQNLLLDAADEAAAERNAQEAREHARTNQERLRRIRDDLQRGIRADTELGSRVDPHLSRARKNARKGEWKAALRAATRSIEADPHGVGARQVEAYSLLMLQRLPEAAGAYLEGMQLGMSGIADAEAEWELCLEEIRHQRGYFSPKILPVRIYSGMGKQVKQRHPPPAPALSLAQFSCSDADVYWEEGQVSPAGGPERPAPTTRFTLELSVYFIKFVHSSFSFIEGFAKFEPRAVIRVGREPTRPQPCDPEPSRLCMLHCTVRLRLKFVGFWLTGLGSDWRQELLAAVREKTVDGLKPNVRYQLRLCASNSSGDSAWSNYVEFETPQPFADIARGRSIPASWKRKLAGRKASPPISTTPPSLCYR